MNNVTESFVIHPDNAAQILGWFKQNRGLAHWTSVDLSDPGFALTTPAYTETGAPYPKPHWKVGNEPAFRIFDISQVRVGEYKLFKRFHAALRMGSQGFSIKVSDGGSRKIRHFLAQAGDGSFYKFVGFPDSGTDIEIFQQVGTKPLTEWEGQCK